MLRRQNPVLHPNGPPRGVLAGLNGVSVGGTAAVAGRSGTSSRGDRDSTGTSPEEGGAQVYAEVAVTAASYIPGMCLNYSFTRSVMIVSASHT